MNAAAIEKIIKELSMRDYKARCLNLTKAQKRKISLKEKLFLITVVIHYRLRQWKPLKSNINI